MSFSFFVVKPREHWSSSQRRLQAPRALIPEVVRIGEVIPEGMIMGEEQGGGTAARAHSKYMAVCARWKEKGGTKYPYSVVHSGTC